MAEKPDGDLNAAQSFRRACQHVNVFSFDQSFWGNLFFFMHRTFAWVKFVPLVSRLRSAESGVGLSVRVSRLSRLLAGLYLVY